jgi:hypothetical protein
MYNLNYYRMKSVYSFVILLSTILVSCDQNRNPLGTEIIQNEDNRIEAFNIQNNTLDLNVENAMFQYNFIRKGTAELTIKGTTSNAKWSKVFTAESGQVTWKGAFEGLQFFTAETCEATLQLFGGESKTITFTIESLSTYEDENTIPFETEVDFSSWDLSNELANVINAEDAPEGSEVIQLQGASTESSTYITYALHRAGGSEEQDQAGDFYPLPNNPQEVWFNVLVKGTGHADDLMVVEFKESDQGALQDDYYNECAKNWHTSLNDDGTDGVQRIIPLNFTDWKWISFRYSDTDFSTVECYGGSGNKIREPHRIRATSINLESFRRGVEVELLFDKPIFTIGRPFDPEKL